MMMIPWHNEPMEYVFLVFALLCVAGAGLLAASGIGALMPALVPARAYRRVTGVAVMAALAAEAVYLVFYPGGEYRNYGAAWGVGYLMLILAGALLLGGALALAGWLAVRRRSDSSQRV